jgi:hypothetical protein
MPFAFQQAQPNNNTHYVGKHPIDAFILGNEAPWNPALANQAGNGGNGVSDPSMKAFAFGSTGTEFAHLGGFSKAISEGHAASDSGYRTGSSGMSRGSNEFFFAPPPPPPSSLPQGTQVLTQATPFPVPATKKVSRPRSESVACQECGKVLTCRSDML